MNRIILAAAAALAIASPAGAATVTFSATSASFSNAVLTNGVATYANPTATSAQISWGVPLNNGGLQSSYAVSATPYYQVQVNAPTDSPTFVFGSFTHNNYPITLAGGALKYVELSITGTVSADGMDLGEKTFDFEFYHDETKNNLVPCPFGGANGQGVNVAGCADRVRDVFNYDSQTFLIGTTSYYLDPEAFNIDGVDAPVFLTREGRANTAQLVGRFVPIGDIGGLVPEPATWSLMIGGFGMAGAALRRRRGPARRPA